MPLTDASGSFRNFGLIDCHVIVGRDVIYIKEDGLDFNSTSTRGDTIDFFEIAQSQSLYLTASLQGVGTSAAGATFVLALEVSNDTQNWVELGSSSTSAGGGIVINIDIDGGFRYGRVKVKTAEGGALTGSTFFCATRSQT